MRRLCEQCAVSLQDTAAFEARAEAFRARGGALPSQPRWRAAVGCAACNHTGYAGRVGVYELVDVGPQVQHLIVQGSTWDQLIAQANFEGRRSMVDDGLIRCAHGLTTFEEVLRRQQRARRLMQRFRYRALDGQGHQVAGNLQAQDAGEAARQLSRQALKVLELTEQGASRQDSRAGQAQARGVGASIASWCCASWGPC